MSWSNWNRPPPPGEQDFASMPFWEFVQTLDPHHPGHRGPGAGVDFTVPHPNRASAGFPGFAWGGPDFGPQGGRCPGGAFRFRGGGFGPWGRGGCHGRSCRRNRDDDETEAREPQADAAGAAAAASDNEQAEKNQEDTPETLREKSDGPAEGESHHPHGHGHGHPHPHGHGHGPGPHWRGHGRRGGRRHGPFGYGPPPPPPYNGAGNGFDFAEMMRSLQNHPLAQTIRDYAEQVRAAAGQPAAADNATANANDGTDVDVFVPPVDIFNTERAFILHVAVPGAKKEDVGVNWDADKGVLNVAGVVYRPGDEEFLRSLSSSERKVGMFERNVELPPAGSEAKDEVDGFGITAKMEDGILIVVVPKLEKEWTEVHKVDIE